ncbi:MAG TPA: aspartyl protease family protein [Pyrinomonadaceae bacterium]|jgi:predicted aspartyl protease
MKRILHTAASGLAAFVMCATFVASVGSSRSVYGAAAASMFDKARERAQRALREGEFEAAETIYRELIEKNPRDMTARLGLSLSLLKQRKNQQAFDAAARVVAIEPMSPRAHSLLGSALLAAGDFRLSVEEFRTALSFKSDDAMAIAGMAMVDFYDNRLAQSLAGLRRAAYLDADEPDYIYNLAQVAARSERYGEAADAYERFLRIAPRTDADRRARIRGLIDFLRYLGTQRALLRPAGADRAVVPFQLVNNRPVVRVRVNGSKETLRFVIDTGAGMCVISNDAAKRLGLRPVARGGTARAVGGGGKFEIVYGFIQSLQMGEARVDNVPIYIREFFNSGEQLDGYIGLSVVAKYLFTIDYGVGEMTLLRDDERPPLDAATATATAPTTTPTATLTNAIELPIRTTSSGFWSSEIHVDGLSKPVNFIVDTGATITVVSEDLSEREQMTRFEQAARLRVYGAAGLTENVPMLLLPRVRVGAAMRPNVSAAVLDMDSINETAGFEQAGILGGNVLRHYRVTFDLLRAVVRLEPLVKEMPSEDNKNIAPVVANQP